MAAEVRSAEEIDFKNLCKKGDGEEVSVDDDIEEEEEVDEYDEDDEASIMVEEEIVVENQSSTEFSLPLITLNEESQEETEESEKETEESGDEAGESEEEAGNEPNIVHIPTRNNNK